MSQKPDFRILQKKVPWLSINKITVKITRLKNYVFIKIMWSF